ncbi:MAG: flavin reductase family protein [Gammaproteobacteria bacterium]|nr:MAG: flavin reductase family protein [Gammaproteobacteria bacterium]
MIVNFESLKPLQRYHWLTQTLIPRPIAWVLTQHESGHLNLAPFSFFTAISSAPPLLMFSAGKKPDGSPKDSVRNAERTGTLVIHIASADLLDPLNQSSATLPAEVSEVDQLGLETLPFEGFDLPRLAAAPVAYGCRVHAIQPMGDVPQSLVFARVETLYVKESAVTVLDNGRCQVSATELDPLARLGAREYATLGDVLQRERPE